MRRIKRHAGTRGAFSQRPPRRFGIAARRNGGSLARVTNQRA
jgi:hypothetical protein